MIDEVAARVARSRRYRHVDPRLLARLAAEESPLARNLADAVKRVKRRLHQAIGSFDGTRGAELAEVAAAWSGDLQDERFRAAVTPLLAGHASTRERLPHLDRLYGRLWQLTGAPRRLLDLGCGLNPLALPWMGLAPDASLIAVDVELRQLRMVDAFLSLVGHPHRIVEQDLVAAPAVPAADVALLLKLVPTLDRQSATAARDLLAALPARHAVLSFPARSLGGRSRGMERTYRARLDALLGQLAERVVGVEEASVPNELVFVLELRAAHG